MTSAHNYSELVAQAEIAVAAVKDPDLKRIAFQKILDDLLGVSAPPHRKTRAEKQSGESKKASTVKAAKGGPKAYVEELIGDGFFEKPQTISQVKAELQNLGHHIPITSLSGPLQKLCQEKRLRRQKLGASGSFAYSDW